MEKENMTNLSPTEITSYWWIRTIKEKVREISIQGSHDKNELKFAEVFSKYTEREWRDLYLKLIPYITKEASKYTKPIFELEIDTFHQDTQNKGHNIINNWLGLIIGCSLPDIRLSSNSAKDSVIYTNMYSASVWYKSCAVRTLPTSYEPSYIITGDEKNLDFYNLLISTVATLNQLDRSFNSVQHIRKAFCTYMSTSQKNNKKVIQMFNYNFAKLCDKGIILGSPWKNTYFCCIKDIDLVGLDKYLQQSYEIANLILQKNSGEKVKQKVKNN